MKVRINEEKIKVKLRNRKKKIIWERNKIKVRIK